MSGARSPSPSQTGALQGYDFSAGATGRYTKSDLGLTPNPNPRINHSGAPHAYILPSTSTLRLTPFKLGLRGSYLAAHGLAAARHHSYSTGPKRTWGRPHIQTGHPQKGTTAHTSGGYLPILALPSTLSGDWRPRYSAAESERIEMRAEEGSVVAERLAVSCRRNLDECCEHGDGGKECCEEDSHPTTPQRLP